MIPNVQWVQQKFSEFNQKYFRGRLPMPQIEVTPIGNNILGRYELPGTSVDQRTRKILKRRDNGILMISNEYEREEKDFMNTLLHEMVHVFIFTIMGISPVEQHGPEFQAVAKRINADGWDVSEDAEILGNWGEESQSGGTNNNGYDCIICVMAKPGGANYKWWLCRADEQSMAQMKTRASSIQGVSSVKFFRCRSKRLMSLEVNANTLAGAGGMTYAKACAALCACVGENPSVLASENLKSV